MMHVLRGQFHPTLTRLGCYKSLQVFAFFDRWESLRGLRLLQQENKTFWRLSVRDYYQYRILIFNVWFEDLFELFFLFRLERILDHGKKLVAEDRCVCKKAF